jgi:hypothetical protein
LLEQLPQLASPGRDVLPAVPADDLAWISVAKLREVDLLVLECFDHRFLLGIMLSSALLNTLLQSEPLGKRADARGLGRAPAGGYGSDPVRRPPAGCRRHPAGREALAPSGESSGGPKPARAPACWLQPATTTTRPRGEALVDALARDAMALLACLEGRELEPRVSHAAQLLATVVAKTWKDLKPTARLRRSASPVGWPRIG